MKEPLKTIGIDVGKIILSLIAGIGTLIVLFKSLVIFEHSSSPHWLEIIFAWGIVLIPLGVLWYVFHRLFRLPFKQWYKSLAVWGTVGIVCGVALNFPLGIQIGFDVFGTFIGALFFFFFLIYTFTQWFVYGRKVTKKICFLGGYFLLVTIIWILPLPQNYKHRSDPKGLFDSWTEEIPCYGIVRIRSDYLLGSSENRSCFGKTIPSQKRCTNSLKPVPCS